jgi:hypothetical protein
MDDYLTKPLDLRKFKLLLENHVAATSSTAPSLSAHASPPRAAAT